MIMTCVLHVMRMEPRQQDTQQIILCNVFSLEQTLVRLTQFMLIYAGYLVYAGYFLLWNEYHFVGFLF